MTLRPPLASLAVAFAAGVSVASAIPPTYFPEWVSLGCPSLLLVVTPRAMAPVSFALGGAAVAWVASADLRSAPFASAPSGAGGPAVLAGRVASVPRRLDDRVAYTLDAGAGGRIEVLSPDLPSGAPLALGDRVLVQAELRPPPGPRNPGGWDRAARLAARGVALEGAARSAPVRTAPPSPLSRLEAARVRFGREAVRVLGPGEASLVRAIGAGDESGMDPAVREAFSRSGLAHVLSVSGLHLAVVAWGAWRAVRGAILRLDRGHRLDAGRWAAAAAVPAAAAFALATGASVPAVRSALGAGLALSAAPLGREPHAGNALALAAMGVLAADPGALLDVSFQLSFAAVGGLLLLAGPLRRALPLRPDRARWTGRAAEALAGAASASAAASLATAPLLALHFRQLPLLAVASNLAGLPLASALTALGALAFLASAVLPPLAAPLLWACALPASALLAVNAAFAWPPWGVVHLASPGGAGAAAAGAGTADVERRPARASPAKVGIHGFMGRSWEVAPAGAPGTRSQRTPDPGYPGLAR